MARAKARARQTRGGTVSTGEHNTTSERWEAETPEKAQDADRKLQVSLSTDDRAQASGRNLGRSLGSEKWIIKNKEGTDQ